MNLWYLLLYQPLVNALIGFYQLFGNLGWAIIGLTFSLRLLLLPLTWPALRAAQKMRQLAPKLEKLRKKYKNDRQKLAQAQIELYRSVGINPLAGFLPQIIQILILIALFQAFRHVLAGNGAIDKLNQVLYSILKLDPAAKLNLRFFYLDLTRPDLIKIGGRNWPGLFLFASAGAQFLSAKLMMASSKVQQKLARKTPQKSDDFAAMMQTQSLYLFPLMTIFIGLSFPSGLVLYWLTFSLFNLIQQVIINKKYGGKK